MSIPLETIQSAYKTAYETVASQHEGACIPHLVVPVMSGLLGIAENHPITQQLLREMRRPHAELYSDVVPYMQKILKTEGSLPIIWTAGEAKDDADGPGYQLLKIESTGLIDEVNPDWYEKANRLQMPMVISHIQKLMALKQYLPEMRERFEGIRIVDDRLENLKQARELIAPYDFDELYYQIHRKGIPTNVEVGRGLQHITSLSEVDVLQSTVYPTDFDYTSIDHQATKQHMSNQLAAVLKQI